METNVTTPNKKSGSLLWWLIGGAGVLAVFMLSSFTTTAASSVSPCASNPDCLKGYWKWQIIKGWYATIVAQAAAANKTVATELDSTALWIISQNWALRDDFPEWESMVSAELLRVKAITPGMAAEDARYIAIENILSRLQK